MSEPDQHDVNPPLSEWRFWAFWGLVTLAAGLVLALATPDLTHVRATDPSLWIIFGLPIVLELGPLFRGRAKRPNGMSSSLMFVFALLLQWGLGIAIICYSVAAIVEACLNRPPIWKPVFNLAQFAVCMGAAHIALAAFGQQASLAHPAIIEAATLPALLVAGATYFTVNVFLVGTVMTLRYAKPWWAEVTLDASSIALNDGAAIALAPLVLLAAERSPGMVPLLLIPLFAVYQGNVVSQKLKHQAGHDALTDLPNRAQLLERAREVFTGVVGGRSVVGLFVLDLDRFKEINDTLGHPAGDRLLRVIAGRLSAAVRPGDLVARLGGDEFAVLLPDLADEEAARIVAARITNAVRAPLQLDGVMLNVDSSLGIALGPVHGTDLEVLMQRADMAMYLAKGRGTACETYSADLSRGSTSRLNLLGDLRLALEDRPGTQPHPGGVLALHYQPQVSLGSGRLVGVEALLRWQHPVRGMICPDEFIDKVEQTALMSALTHRVIDDALAQVARWEAQGLSVRVAVNVSVTDLHREGFAAYVAARLRDHAVDPRLLQLEITERALMVDAIRVVATLKALERLGVSLSLDDFGTGYSSMSLLHRLPVGEIKIDRSFVAGMSVDVDDRTIVRSMIELGHALGLRVVAEGVEDLDTWTQLGEMGCDDAQGWHISHVLPEIEMTAWLKQNPRRPRLLSVVRQVDSA